MRGSAYRKGSRWKRAERHGGRVGNVHNSSAGVLPTPRSAGAMRSRRLDADCPGAAPSAGRTVRSEPAAHSYCTHCSTRRPFLRGSAPADVFPPTPLPHHAAGGGTAQSVRIPDNYSSIRLEPLTAAGALSDPAPPPSIRPPCQAPGRELGRVV